jgi:hypothetical protein
VPLNFIQNSVRIYERNSVLQFKDCDRGAKNQEPPQSSRCQNGDMKFRSDDPQILGATVQNLVTRDSFTR